MKNFLLLCSLFLTYQSVNAQCSVTINSPSQAISNCMGPQLSANTSGGPGPYAFNWTSSTLSFTAPTSPSTAVSSTSPGFQVVNLIVIDGNGCTAVATDTIEFFSPVDTFNISYCTLPDSVCILDCPMTVQGWTYTDTMGNASNLPLTNCVAIQGPGEYGLFGYYQTNCTVLHTYNVIQDCGSGCSVEINGPSQAISNCMGPQFSANPSGPGPYSYVWSSPTLSIFSPTAASTSASASSVGFQTITVIVMDGNGCTATDTDTIEFIAPMDTFNISYCTLPDSICVFDCPVTVQSWTYTDTLGNGTNLPQTDCVAIQGPGEYKLFGIYETNCTVIHVYNVVEDCGSAGIIETDATKSLKVFPNPASNVVRVVNTDGNLTEVVLTDINGRELKRQRVEGSEVKITLDSLPNGLYILQIRSSESFTTEKLMVVQ